jgi:hypothetical protein
VFEVDHEQTEQVRELTQLKKALAATLEAGDVTSGQSCGPPGPGLGTRGLQGAMLKRLGTHIGMKINREVNKEML